MTKASYNATCAVKTKTNEETFEQLVEETVTFYEAYINSQFS